MVETATSQQASKLPAEVAPKKVPWEVFERRYLAREDRYKYEWVNGQIEKTPRNMDSTQFFIVANLLRFLYALKAGNARLDGELIAEGDTFFAGNHRRPDIAYYTNAQIRTAKNGTPVVPDFVVEIISKQDQIEKVEQKMEDYTAAGVSVIWLIFPTLKKVHVYRGRHMEVCKGTDRCSAEPVIPGFVLPAQQIFE